jgi:hypothetical protein
MRIEIETDGTTAGTFISLNGTAYKDISSFLFIIKPHYDKAKMQMRRIVKDGPDAFTNLFGTEFSRFDEEMPPPEPVENTT